MLMLSVTAAEIAPHNPCVVYLSTICSCYRLVGDLQVATAPFRTPADGNGIASPPPLPLSLYMRRLCYYVNNSALFYV
jgi:hypothetical protein